jgi:hypothetical protein
MMSGVDKSSGNAKKNAAGIAAFLGGAEKAQPNSRMNSPIFGQIVSRQRRPEKMP